MSYVLPPRRAIQDLGHLMTDEEKKILENVRERERQQKAERAAAMAKHIEEFEARRDAQDAADRDARAKPTQILARQIAGHIPHLELHRVIQDIARTNREQLVAELQLVWQRDEDKRGAGKLAKPVTSESMTPGQAVLARHGLAE